MSFHSQPKARRAGTLGSLSALFAVLSLAAGCGGHASAVPSLPLGPLSLDGRDARTMGRAQPDSAAGKITHIVIVIQENHSFDSLFHGFKGADYATTGKTESGKVVTLKPISFAAKYDLCHNYTDALIDVYATPAPGGPEVMDGFSHCKPLGMGAPANPAYVYIDPAQTKPYFTLAQSYGLADEFFSSQLDGSYVAHQYLIAAQAGMAEDQPDGAPWGCDAPENTTVPIANDKGVIVKNVFPCFTYTALANEMDTKKVTWRYYSPPMDNFAFIWQAYDAIKSIRDGKDWTSDIVQNQCQILTDAQSGNLPQVTWVVPDLPDSDHPQSDATTGPKWVTAIVNAIGQSTLWKNTAVFVMWDDWGGFYDHVPPPVKAGKGFAPDWDGPGMRVPLIAISPYSKTGAISSLQYDGFAAVLKTVEGLDGLTPLTTRDKAAASLFSDTTLFDFTQTARTFTPFSNPGYSCNPSDSRPNDTDYGRPSGSDGDDP